MARNEIDLTEDERRSRIVIGVPIAVEAAWTACLAKAKDMHCQQSVSNALSKRVAEAVAEIEQALNSRLANQLNGHVVTDR